MRKRNLDRHPRKSRPGADIDQCLNLPHITDLHNRKTVYKMLLHNLFILCNRGQIHDLVLFYQKLIIGQKLSYLPIGQDNSQCFTTPAQYIFIYHPCYFSPLNPVEARYTSNTDTSAGDTPASRDACPIDSGRYMESFCLASVRRLGTVS